MMAGSGGLLALEPLPTKPSPGPISMSELQPRTSRRSLVPQAAFNAAIGVSSSPCHSTCNDVPQSPRPSLLAGRRFYPATLDALLPTEGGVINADCDEDSLCAEVSEQLPCVVPERHSPGQSLLGSRSHKVISGSPSIWVSEPSGPPSPAKSVHRASEGISMGHLGTNRPRDLPMFAAAAISAPPPGSPSVHGMRPPSVSLAASVAAAGVGYTPFSPFQSDADVVESGGNTSPCKTPTRRLHGGGGGSGVAAAPILILAAGSELGERQPSCSGCQPLAASVGEGLEAVRSRRSSIMAWSTVSESATGPVPPGLSSGNSCTTLPTTSSISPTATTATGKPPPSPRASIGFSRRPEDLPAAPTPAHSRSLAGSTSTTPTGSSPGSQSSGPSMRSHPPLTRLTSQFSIGLSRRPEDLPAAPSPSASRSLGCSAEGIRSGASTPASPGGSGGGWRLMYENVHQLAGQSRRLGSSSGLNSAPSDNLDPPVPAQPPAGQPSLIPSSPRYPKRHQEDPPLMPARAEGSCTMPASAAGSATSQRGPPLAIGSSSAHVRSSLAAPPSPRASIGFSRRPEDLPAAPTPAHSRSLAGSTSTTPTGSSPGSQSSGPSMRSHPPLTRLTSQFSIGLSRRPEDLPAAPSPSASRSLAPQGKGTLQGPGGDSELLAPGTPPASSSPFSSQSGQATAGGALGSCRWVALPPDSASSSSTPVFQRSGIHNNGASATTGLSLVPIPPSISGMTNEIEAADEGAGEATRSNGVSGCEGHPSPSLGVSRRPEDLPAAPSPTASRSLRPDSSRAAFRCNERQGGGGAGLRPCRPPSATGMAPTPPPQPVPPPGAAGSMMGCSPRASGSSIRGASSLLWAAQPPPQQQPPPSQQPQGVAVGRLCDDGTTGDDMAVMMKGAVLEEYVD